AHEHVVGVARYELPRRHREEDADAGLLGDRHRDGRAADRDPVGDVRRHALRDDDDGRALRRVEELRDDAPHLERVAAVAAPATPAPVVAERAPLVVEMALGPRGRPTVRILLEPAAPAAGAMSAART